MKKFKQISALLIVLGMFLQAAPFVLQRRRAMGKPDINAKIRKEAMENLRL